MSGRNHRTRRHSVLVGPRGLQRIAVRPTPLRRISWSWMSSCESFYDSSPNLSHYLAKHNDSDDFERFLPRCMECNAVLR